LSKVKARYPEDLRGPFSDPFTEHFDACIEITPVVYERFK
jgi:hypothetical protein